jgi:thymidylate kinase
VKARGRFISFEGLDGAGKTTMARLVAGELSDAGVATRFVERKNGEFPTPELTRRMALLKELIWEYGDLPLHEYGDEHALFNMASWFSVLDRCKIKPLLDQGCTVIIDNWYYKFASRFRAKPGINFALVKQCFSHLSRPDAVIFLDVSPSVAGGRKEQFSRGECGNFDGMTGLTRENFIRYQESVQIGLLEFAREDEWIRIAVDDRSVMEVKAEALDRLRATSRPDRLDEFRG